ncbi:MAG: hypothetical protein Q8N53_18030 [Longimicrobiales bacterium]|nr:hypothetical protein [Longimicrobiales bacterium]
MSPKKTILSALSRTHEESQGAAFTRPAAIPGFSAEPDRFQKAVNELLKDRLIEGRRDQDGHMAVALNAHRLADVRRHLRPAWAHPALWATALVAGALGAGLMM